MVTPVRVAPAPRLIPVGIGQFHVSSQPQDVLVASNLGSCVAVVLHDVRAQTGGIAHVQSPGCESRTEPAPASDQGGASRDVPRLLDEVLGAGASKFRLRVALVGGASTLSSSQFFQIGRRNYLAIKAILWQYGILVGIERVGGTQWRTVKLHVNTGKILISNPKGQEEF